MVLFYNLAPPLMVCEESKYSWTFWPLRQQCKASVCRATILRGIVQKCFLNQSCKSASHKNLFSPRAFIQITWNLTRLGQTGCPTIYKICDRDAISARSFSTLINDAHFVLSVVDRCAWRNFWCILSSVHWGIEELTATRHFFGAVVLLAANGYPLHTAKWLRLSYFLFVLWGLTKLLAVAEIQKQLRRAFI